MLRVHYRTDKAVTGGHGIDFEYYDKHAHQLRSDAFANLFRAFRSRGSEDRQAPTNGAVSNPCC